MGETFAATIPVFLVILLGGGLAYRQYVPPGTWAQFQKLNYYAFIPALFLSGLSVADFSDAPLLRIVVTVAATLGAAAAVVWVWRSRSTRAAKLGPQILEASIRGNVPYGMGIALALGGTEGLALFLVAAATYLPTAILAGGLFNHFVGRQDLDPEAEQEYALASAIRLLATNPIIWGAGVGIALNVANIPLVSGVAAMVQFFGYAAVPVGLLGAGAALNIAAAQNALDAARGAAMGSLALNLLVLPLGAGVLALTLNLEGPAAISVVLIAALPCVVPRFSVLGKDAQSILPGVATMATLASALSVPVALWLLT
jgi:malonate transporter